MRIIICACLLLVTTSCYSQSPDRKFHQDAAGSYELSFSKATRFNIIENDSLLYLHVVGQGRVPIRLGKNGLYTPDIVRPKAEIRFLKNEAGLVTSFQWAQKTSSFTWTRLPKDSTLIADTSKSEFDGRYGLPGSGLPVFIKENPDGSLRSLVYGETPLRFMKISNSSFTYKHGGFEIDLQFDDLKNGKYEKIHQKRKGPLEFVRLGQGDEGYFKTIPNGKTGFNRADTLQGSLSPLRSCFDVSFYNLDIKLDPGRRYLSGSNLVRLKAQADFRRIQLDLVRNLHINRITWRGKPLDFTREYNAVYINFPEPIAKGSIEEIIIQYYGYPQQADISSLSGGFMWMHDRNGNDWIEVVTQGTGASTWWPCKDHLSDEPDSMQINVTLPKGMQNISNGRKRKETIIGDSAIRTEWFVSYPINTYNVTLNIGDYRQLVDFHVNGRDTLALNFYYLPYNRRAADTLMEEMKTMLRVYDRLVGRYPFWRDGLTVLESLYPMEHQGAVSIGSINEPVFSSKTNMDGLKSLVWHEVGHEWWGNSVSVSDNADIWFHEAFTTYLEILRHEIFRGEKEAVKRLFSDLPPNDDKMVGEYGVNHFKLNTVYNKGALMIHTLRGALNDDSLFFGLLKAIQKDLALRTINSDTIIDYVCRYTGKPLRPFFQQYLYHPSLPKLEMQVKEDKGGNMLRYRWKADVPLFWLPVRLVLPGNQSRYLVATEHWQEAEIGKVLIDDIKIDREHFYIDELRVKPGR